MDLESYARLGELADYVVPFALRLACDLRLADLLREGPLPVAELAERTGTHTRSLCRMLRALACRGVFAEHEQGVFGLTPLSEVMRSDHPLSFADSCPLLPFDVRAWSALDHAVRTGESAFAKVNGEEYHDYLARRPADSARADGAMRGVNTLHLRSVLPHCDWAGVRTLVDVGGGEGAFLSAVLARFPEMRGILLDQPHVLEGAPDVLREAGVADRCETVPGDFFVDIPAGADCYLLKTVLPGWDDQRASTLLRRVRAAMRPDSTLVLLEAVLLPGNEFDLGKLIDLHTLVLTGGRHRTVEELDRLLRGAGLRLQRRRPTSTLTVLEARPADG
nr:methyltransferase [Streptomyces sp. SID8354]